MSTTAILAILIPTLVVALQGGIATALPKLNPESTFAKILSVIAAMFPGSVAHASTGVPAALAAQKEFSPLESAAMQLANAVTPEEDAKATQELRLQATLFAVSQKPTKLSMRPPPTGTALNTFLWTFLVAVFLVGCTPQQTVLVKDVTGAICPIVVQDVIPGGGPAICSSIEEVEQAIADWLATHNTASLSEGISDHERYLAVQAYQAKKAAARGPLK